MTGVNGMSNGFPQRGSGLSVNNPSVASSIKKLSTGFKINSAADDAAGLAISEKLRSLSGGLGQASINAQNGVSAIQTAEGGLSGSSDILSRMRELAVQASSGTYSDDERSALNKEFTQLKDSLDQIASSTNYNGTKLLDGSLDANGAAAAGLNLQIGADGNGSSRMSVNIGDMSAEALGLKDINILSADGAGKALEALDSAIDTVGSVRGDLGASQNRLETTIANIDGARYNAVSSESNIRDLDMANEMVNSTLEKIRNESQNAMAAHGMDMMRQSVISLLQK